MATSSTLGSSFACTLSTVALRDLKVAQPELVCQLQYPTSIFFTPFWQSGTLQLMTL